ncbi:MAG TPA: glycosyltransferase family 1 protein [Thermoanaerobaculia bacterium]|jgi:UDP-galactopyranose mutase|nr:glycosyltransferase family 1 protein [Thermoanaerobaculia bacterium]
MQPLNEINEVDEAVPGEAPGPASRPDVVCLSHLRWDFVYQRPQHLMSRFARQTRVFFVEEPVWEDGPPRLEVGERPEGVRVAVPHLPHGLSPEAAEEAQRALLLGLLEDHAVTDYVLWYYTPMALGYSSGLAPAAVIYDCMDELSLFRGAPPTLLEREARLLALADLVFTGGQSLYEAKRDRHPQVHAFPSSIDAGHFGRARAPLPEPSDQAALPRPRLGYFGVIDERIDLDLVAAVAGLRPDWQLVMVGPVVKIDPESLPRRANLHYLGMKPYAELPSYLAGWDVALMPFARNESTRFISPTKTPEYLAGGKPVVSTPVRDVVRPYGELEMVEIAEEPADFAAAVERALARHGAGGSEREAWLRQVDDFLARGSWSRTWQSMSDLIDAAVRDRRGGRRY